MLNLLPDRKNSNILTSVLWIRGCRWDSSRNR